ncbi:hypothetical protein [Pseudorhodoferax sp. Leaf265]|uniref:hypothetical protein n=1 Tax=Pseudorhodoferax sp. Leaf265 TaxID=1736315 RepID=UPI0006FF5FC5|nr:hypothetical protein [Pseudorhodoferax sp. Leaf265]KQP06253.1 hypothetical protein ASF45_09240 [Pseudorhodoferax sp. Leaf265]
MHHARRHPDRAARRHDPAGLRIDVVREHEALPWRPYPDMVAGADRLFRLPAGHVRLPLALSIGATRAG